MQTVLTAWEEGVTTITLNRPDLRNAFNDDAVRELRAAFEALDERTRLVVLTGAGDAFCAGADLNWMKKSASYSERENATDAGAMVGLFKAINECPVPVIGRVNGHAMGGGLVWWRAAISSLPASGRNSVLRKCASGLFRR